MTDIIIYSNIENVNRVHKKFKYIKKQPSSNQRKTVLTDRKGQYRLSVLSVRIQNHQCLILTQTEARYISR